MSYNAVLMDRKDEQVLPITTAENVFYNGSTTVKQAIDDIIAGRGGTGSGINPTYSHNRIEVGSIFGASPTANVTPFS